jgi:glutamate-1-semialdehyde 2,1-aminomutase
VAERSSASNADWFARAQRVIPGGVDSPVRSFASVGGTPYTVVAGEGPYVVDAEGTRYVDMVQSYGAVLLGHAHPVVTAAVAEAAARGTTFGAPTPGEVLLAEAICARVPGCEQVRLVSSGTEAAMSAVRLARGATGRDRVVKFDGCYHGHSDGLLAGGGSGVAMLGLPGSAGVSAGAVADTEVVPYNVVPALDERVACVIVEPVAANMNLVPPAPGFLEGLRAACDAAGALLVFDEVITGFRLGPEGATGWSGVAPDLWCFGKVIGGGLPVGAFGGRRALMEELAPAGPVYQAGTLSGNPLAVAAGLATLRSCTPEVYARVDSAAAAVAKLASSALTTAGVPFWLSEAGSLFSVFLGVSGPVRDFAQARGQSPAAYAAFFHAMLSQGVYLPPSPYEAWFLSAAHDDAAIGRIAAALPSAARAAAQALA